MTHYDALLFVSFGGPEGPEDVMPFLRNVTAGRDVPEDRLAEVAEHYHHFGGRSPINEQNRAIIAALEGRLEAEGPALPVYFGNRNWDPYLTDTLREMAADGVRRALAFVTSAYSSYSSCRQYREDLARARTDAEVEIEIDKIRAYYNHPGFVEAQTARAAQALQTLPESSRRDAPLLFTTHSLPLTMARHCDYEAQTYEVARLVAGRLGGERRWEVAYCSRSGPPHQPWLVPDVADRLAGLAVEGAEAVVVVPVGFISDHMEVAFDLDVEARDAAEDAGLDFARAATAGTHPRFVDMIRDLVLERSSEGPVRWVGTRGPDHDACPADCCLTPGQDRLPTVASAASPRP